MSDAFQSSYAAIIENYRSLLKSHGSGPAVSQQSAEGQRFRFEQLAKVGPLDGKTLLDIGCGLGDFYPFLCDRFGEVAYTGVDIVPDLVRAAAARHPSARFEERDLIRSPFSDQFDYVFISGVFNNAVPAGEGLLQALIAAAFAHAKTALAFNFISSYVNVADEGMAYHDPSAVLTFCIERLSRKVLLHHHYERCDAAVFVYR